MPRAGVVEQLAQAGLVGVEQVLLDGLARGLGVILPRRELVERERRLRARAREARRRAVLAQQQPALRGRGVAARGRLGDDRVGAAEEPGADRAAGGGERGLVVVARRPAPRPRGRRAIALSAAGSASRSVSRRSPS